jgi:Fe-S-cluster containining protein
MLRQRLLRHHAPGRDPSAGKAQKGARRGAEAGHRPRNGGRYSREEGGVLAGILIRTLAKIDLVSRRSTRMSCPALENGACVLYEHRPHICRIFGPTVRGKRRAVHLEGCGYFEKELPETDFSILNNYADEDVLLKAMFTKAGRKRVLELDTIIPAAIAMDLRKWL